MSDLTPVVNAILRRRGHYEPERIIDNCARIKTLMQYFDLKREHIMIEVLMQKFEDEGVLWGDFNVDVEMVTSPPHIVIFIDDRQVCLIKAKHDGYLMVIEGKKKKGMDLDDAFTAVKEIVDDMNDSTMLSHCVSRLRGDADNALSHLPNVKVVEGYHRFYSAPTVEVTTQDDKSLASVVVTDEKYIIHGDEEVSYEDALKHLVSV